MSSYDTFNIPGTSDHVQLKNGPCTLQEFSVGDDVSLVDGVYISDNGVVVILNSKYHSYFSYLIDKWGRLLDTGAIIRPVVQTLREEDFDATKQRFKKEGDYGSRPPKTKTGSDDSGAG